MADYNSLPITQLQPGLAVQLTDVYAAVDINDPTQSPSGSTKKYTISQLQDYISVQTTGSNILSADVATTENLVASYVNGTGGIGATLSNAGTFIALTIDGINVAVGDRVLVWLQNTSYENGVYEVTDIGSASTRWILTRVTDYNGHVPLQIDRGDFIGVTLGATNALEFWFMTSETPLVVGVDPIIFETAVTAAPPSGQAWFDVTSSPQVMVAGAGYVANTLGLCSLIMPVSANVGDKIDIQARGNTLFRITQNTGQQTFIGNVGTTVGPTGYIESIDLGSSLTLVCTVANTEFHVLTSPQGSGFTII